MFQHTSRSFHGNGVKGGTLQISQGSDWADLWRKKDSGFRSVTNLGSDAQTMV